MISTTLQISEDGILTIPDDMLEELGWKEGDELEWVEQDNGAFILRKSDAKEEGSTN
tara:strand:+ start:1703 stop:1873 length:171 start_codon:yes stop_codon:yes gene_type:complete